MTKRPKCQGPGQKRRIHENAICKSQWVRNLPGLCQRESAKIGSRNGRIRENLILHGPAQASVE